MSIEAVINEVHADIMESYPHVIEKLPEGAAKRIRDCWSDESSTYERYKLVLCCANHEVFSVKDDIGAKARYLICLRNALVHYHSAWNPPARQKGREKMAERLIREGAFRRSPLVAERGPLFPHQILSSSCAFWAATTAEKLVREFVRRMDIARAFPRFGGDTRPIAVAGQLESQPSTPAIAGGPPSAP